MFSGDIPFLLKHILIWWIPCSSQQLSLRIRPAKVLSSRQPPCAEEVQGDECPARQQTGRLSEVRSKAEGGVSSAHGSVPGSHTEGRKTKRHGQHRRDRAKVVAEVRSWTRTTVFGMVTPPGCREHQTFTQTSTAGGLRQQYFTPLS